MLNTSPIIAFAAITDVTRARRFYEETLGLAFVADEPPALVFDANGTMLRLAKLPAVNAAPYTVLGWQVADIRAARDRLAANGVVFEQYPELPQDERGICTFPGGSRVAWFKDPDGNLLSLTQFA